MWYVRVRGATAQHHAVHCKPQAYTKDGDEAMVLATPIAAATGPQAALKQVNCDFWDANALPSSVVFGTLML